MTHGIIYLKLLLFTDVFGSMYQYSFFIEIQLVIKTYKLFMEEPLQWEWEINVSKFEQTNMNTFFYERKYAKLKIHSKE